MQKKILAWIAIPISVSNDFTYNITMLIDHEARRKRPYIIEFGGFRVVVQQRGKRQTMLVVKRPYVRSIVPQRDAHDSQSLRAQLLMKCFHQGHFKPTRRTPSSPKIQQNHFALEVLKPDYVSVEILQEQIRRQLFFDSFYAQAGRKNILE